MSLGAPEALGPQHRFGDFYCGEPALDGWLVGRALPNQVSGASRTFVVCTKEQSVAAYYALASGAVAARTAPDRFRRNMPDPIPVVLSARLAVDRAYQGKGLGRALVRDGLERAVRAASHIGVRGVVVNAASPSALAFYEHVGFTPVPGAAALALITLADAAAALQKPC